jgi:hypothetical protein
MPSREVSKIVPCGSALDEFSRRHVLVEDDHLALAMDTILPEAEVSTNQG